MFLVQREKETRNSIKKPRRGVQEVRFYRGMCSLPAAGKEGGQYMWRVVQCVLSKGRRHQGAVLWLGGWTGTNNSTT